MSPSEPAPPPRERAGGERGLVLLEILVALLIFTFVVLAWSRLADNALDSAARANLERTLRLLAARKLAEIRAKPAAMVEGGEGGFEEDGVTGEGEEFLDYRWRVEARTVFAAGWGDDAESEFLFEDDETAGQPAAPEGGGRAPEAVKLTRLTLKVSHQGEGQEDEDYVRIVTYVPPPKEEPSK